MKIMIMNYNMLTA